MKHVKCAIWISNATRASEHVTSKTWYPQFSPHGWSDMVVSSSDHQIKFLCLKMCQIWIQYGLLQKQTICSCLLQWHKRNVHWAGIHIVFSSNPAGTSILNAYQCNKTKEFIDLQPLTIHYLFGYVTGSSWQVCFDCLKMFWFVLCCGNCFLWPCDARHAILGQCIFLLSQWSKQWLLTSIEQYIGV